MKKQLTVALVLLLLISKPLAAQNEVWSDPVSFTDSITDNRNATVKRLRFIEEDYYVFWEKSPDTISTAIYFKNFYSNDNPQVFLSGSGINYTNPQLIDSWFTKYVNDSLFYVFYESDETGTNRIYFKIYNPDSFTEPEALTESTEEQTNLLCSNDGDIVWMEQNRIMFMKLDKYAFSFNEPVVIDSGNCSFPSVYQNNLDWWGGNQVVAWIKEVNNTSSVMVSWYDSGNGWLEPETIFTGSQNSNLSFCTGIGPPEILTWDYFNDTSWHIANYDLQDSELYICEFSLEYQPFAAFYSGIIPVKDRWMDAGLSTFIYNNGNSVNVFSSEFYYGVYPPFDAYQNVSESENIVRNPQLFSGKRVGCIYYFINIWEEFVNNHWQIKYSINHECLSGIEEKKNIEINNIEVNPNPTINSTNISFSLDNTSEVVLSICNSSGVVIETLEKSKLSAGEHSYIWHGDRYKPGLYFVMLKSELGLVTKKIILF